MVESAYTNYVIASAWCLAVALIAGAVGGIAGDLLQPHRGKLGFLRRWGAVPRASQTKTHTDLGWAGSAIVGAVAAAIALALYPSDLGVWKTSGATFTFDGLRVIGYSALIGTAGGAVITALNERAMRLVEVKKAADTNVAIAKKVSLDELKRIDEKLGTMTLTDIDVQALRKDIESSMTEIKRVGNSTENGNPAVEDF